MQMTFEQLDPNSYPMQTATVSDFLAKAFLLLESEGDLKTQEALYSLRSCGWRQYANLGCYSLKTSEDYLVTMEEGLSAQSSQLWGNWGMSGNTKFLTAKILECHKTEKECSLSDILEKQVDQKYFLSAEATKKLLNNLLEDPKETEYMTRGGVSVTLSSGGGGRGAKTGLYLLNNSKFNKLKLSVISQTLRGGAEPCKQPLVIFSQQEVKQN